MRTTLYNSMQHVDSTSDRMGILTTGHKGRSRQYYRVLELWLKGLTYAEIGRRLGFSRQFAQEVMRPLASMKRQVIEEAWFRCERCDCALGKTGHIHHITRTYPPNVRKNLQYLCISCHRRCEP